MAKAGGPYDGLVQDQPHMRLARLEARMDEMLAAQTRLAEAWRDGAPLTDQQQRDEAKRDAAKAAILDMVRASDRQDAMPRPKVFLSGPISGLTYDGSEAWREEFEALVGPEITCLSPLRAKHFLRPHGAIEQSYGEVSTLSSDRGIMTRDHYDCARADLVVCNLSGVNRVSIGTVMEVAWAFAYRKPLVMIMEPGSVHDHPMIREAISFRAKDVAEAAALVRAILLP